jgi:predicted nucleic acid-binding protein
MAVVKVYWDSCCFLACLNREPEHCAAFDDIIKEAEGKRLKIVASPLTLAEVMHIKGYSRCSRSQQEQIKRFFDQQYISIRDVTSFIGFKAQELLWENTALQPWDALHLATALFYKIPTLHTTDKVLLQLSNKFRQDEITICKPIGVPQMRLDLQISED